MKSQVKELDVLLAYDESHVKVIPGVPTIGFRNNKNLKSHWRGGQMLLMRWKETSLLILQSYEKYKHF